MYPYYLHFLRKKCSSKIRHNLLVTAQHRSLTLWNLEFFSQTAHCINKMNLPHIIKKLLTTPQALTRCLPLFQHIFKLCPLHRQNEQELDNFTKFISQAGLLSESIYHPRNSRIQRTTQTHNSHNWYGLNGSSYFKIL